MIKMTHRYAAALLEYAEENGLEMIYRQALSLVLAGKADFSDAPEEIGGFLSAVKGEAGEISAILYKFLDMARERMDLLEAEIITAVPLTDSQLAVLEKKLILMFRKQLDIRATVDPSVLGGVRVIINNTVLDDTIKRKLRDMKNSIYEGVYMREWV